MTRRNFLQTALAMPIGAAFAHYRALAAPAQGLTKITRIQALQLKEGRTLIRVDTDAGLSGYGECNTAGPAARSAIVAYNGAGRLPNLALIGKDPLAIQVHFHNMFYAYPQRGAKSKCSAESIWRCGTWRVRSSISRFRSYSAETFATRSCSTLTPLAATISARKSGATRPSVCSLTRTDSKRSRWIFITRSASTCRSSRQHRPHGSAADSPGLHAGPRGFRRRYRHRRSLPLRVRLAECD